MGKKNGFSWPCVHIGMHKESSGAIVLPPPTYVNPEGLPVSPPRAFATYWPCPCAHASGIQISSIFVIGI